MNRTRTTGIVRLVIAFLVVEFLVVLTGLLVLVVELFTAPADSVPSALALVVLAALAAVWSGVMVVAAVRGRAWVRGSAIVWQVLQFAVGVSALTGVGGQPLLGWPLLLLAAALFFLLLSPPVVGALSDRTERA